MVDRVVIGDDSTPQPGFDQDLYAGNAEVSHRSLEDIIAEFVAVRASTYALLKGLTPEMMTSMGSASDSTVSVRALFYMLAGHAEHHLNILERRYLPAT